MQEEASEDEAEESLDSVMEDVDTLDVSFGNDEGVEIPTTPGLTSEQAQQIQQISQTNLKQVQQRSKARGAHKENANEVTPVAGLKRVLSRKNGYEEKKPKPNQAASLFMSVFLVL